MGEIKKKSNPPELKQKYKDYLDGLVGTFSNYPSALENDIFKELLSILFGKEKESVYEITSPEDVQQIINFIETNKKYKKINSEKHNRFSASLKKYKIFLQSRNQGKNNSDDKSEEKFPLQKILYGAPGTGKSYYIKEKVEDMGKIVYRTTFHPDTDYATFVGCYKPCMNGNNIEYEFTPQVFLIAYLRAWYEYLRFDLTQTNQSANPSSGHEIVEENEDDVLDNDAGEKEDNIEEAEGEEKKQDNHNETNETKAEKVFLVIEEINRGNCAQIFGDIFQLLDRINEKNNENNGFSTYPIVPDQDIVKKIEGFFNDLNNKDYLNRYNDIISSISKKNSSTKKDDDNLPDILKNSNGIKLAFPPNFHIWATMNTSDQSLYPMDSAFKRRWEWKYVKIDTKKDKVKNLTITINKHEFKWPDVIEKINNTIKEILHTADKQIGEFFVKSLDGKSIDFIQFRDKVLFYLFNDVFKDNKKFGEDFFGNDGNYLFEDLLSMDENEQQRKVEKWLKEKLEVSPLNGNSEGNGPAKEEDNKDDKKEDDRQVGSGVNEETNPSSDNEEDNDTVDSTNP